MAINPSEFNLHNITDTCAVWNVLSSSMLFCRAKQAGVMFYCTSFVIYECLYKKRKNMKAHDTCLQQQLRSLIQKDEIREYFLDVDDLQEVDSLYNRKRLGKGELSSIAFARKSRIAFLSDDQKARKLALETLPSGHTQTTPHLLSWLIFCGKISDSEKNIVISEHRSNGGDISKHFEEGYLEGCRCRYSFR